tara:strand:+ start:219 stop:461 length:243 start_codon:yes stop_codon:yes gene_type:complete
MKSMTDLNLEGKLIQIYPGDSVQKFGEVLHVTKEGIMVKVTKVDQGGWSTSDGWEVGSIQFLNWTRLKFKICDSELVQAA